jgi:hypothetical protein
MLAPGWGTGTRGGSLPGAKVVPALVVTICQDQAAAGTINIVSTQVQLIRALGRSTRFTQNSRSLCTIYM